MAYPRNLYTLIKDPLLSDKVMLITGPRQVGKTYLARQWQHETGDDDLYYNWDNEKIRREFRKDPVFFESQVRIHGKGARITFDEIHKISDWKTLLKGYYDTLGSDFRFLVTGSARLEMFQRSGDSMVGRYHLFNLWPLTAIEAGLTATAFPDSPLNFLEFDSFLNHLEQKPCPQDLIDSLLTYSGFPEPLQKQSNRFHRLWQREYKQRLLREDLTDLTRIRDLIRAEHMMELLPSKIGSPLSLNSLKEDLGGSYDAAGNLIKAFHKLALIFSIRPYSKNIKNALKKEPKVYFYDWSLIHENGPKFENFIAVQLMAFCSIINDGGWGNCVINYLRDKQKREVDFLLLLDGHPILLIETKYSYQGVNKNLLNFTKQISVPMSIQVVKEKDVYVKHSETHWSISANRFVNLLI